MKSDFFYARAIFNAAAVSPCYSVFWNAIDFCRRYTSKQISMWALPTVPLFAGKSRFFTRNVPLKTISRLAGLGESMFIVERTYADGSEGQNHDKSMIEILPFVNQEFRTLPNLTPSILHCVLRKNCASNMDLVPVLSRSTNHYT